MALDLLENGAQAVQLGLELVDPFLLLLGQALLLLRHLPHKLQVLLRLDAQLADHSKLLLGLVQGDLQVGQLLLRPVELDTNVLALLLGTPKRLGLLAQLLLQPLLAVHQLLLQGRLCAGQQGVVGLHLTCKRARSRG